MEPAAIAAEIETLLASNVKVIDSCDALLGRFEHADQIALPLISELRTIRTSLEQIKPLIREQSYEFHGRPILLGQITDGMAACSLLLKVTSQDLQKINTLPRANVKLAQPLRLELIWNNRRRRQILGGFEGLSYIFAILLSGLLSQSSEERLSTYDTYQDALESTFKSIQKLTPPSLVNHKDLIETGSRFRFSNSTRAHVPDQPLPDYVTYAIQVPSWQTPYVSNLQGLYPLLTSSSHGPADLEELFSAIWSQNYELIRILVDARVSLSTGNGFGHSPLSEAIHLGDLEASEILMPDSDLELECANSHCMQMRPVHIAAQVNSVDILDLLRVNGAQFDTLTAQQRNALHCAARNDSVQSGTYLTQHGLSMMSEDGNGDTPLHVAIDAKSERFIEYTVSRLENALPEVIEMRNAQGRTPVQHAVDISWWRGLDMLLTLGADVHVTGEGEISLLHQVARQGAREKIGLLRDEGIQLEVCNSHRCTPMHYAASSTVSPSQTVRALHRLGADINARDFQNCTPMHYAVSSTLDPCTTIRTLHELGADINAQADDEPVVNPITNDGASVGGGTPLIAAVHMGKADVVRCLLDLGARIDITKRCGCGVLQIARQAGNFEIFQLVFERQFATRPNMDHPDTATKARMLSLAYCSDDDFPRVCSEIFQTTVGEMPVMDCPCRRNFNERLAKEVVRYCIQDGEKLPDTTLYLGNDLFQYLQDLNQIGMVDGINVVKRRVKRQRKEPEKSFLVEIEDDGVEVAEERDRRVRREGRARKLARARARLVNAIPLIIWLILVLALWIAWARKTRDIANGPSSKSHALYTGANVITWLGGAAAIGITFATAPDDFKPKDYLPIGAVIYVCLIGLFWGIYGDRRVLIRHYVENESLQVSWCSDVLHARDVLAIAVLFTIFILIAGIGASTLTDDQPATADPEDEAVGIALYCVLALWFASWPTLLALSGCSKGYLAGGLVVLLVPIAVVGGLFVFFELTD